MTKVIIRQSNIVRIYGTLFPSGYNYLYKIENKPCCIDLDQTYNDKALLNKNCLPTLKPSMISFETTNFSFSVILVETAKSMRMLSILVTPIA